VSDWLPPLCELGDFDHDWQKYEDHLYSLFRRDFVVSPPRVGGHTVQINTVPYEKGKEEAFWHLITEDQEVVRDGQVRKERLPDLRRCARIRWPGAILREGESDRVVVWRERRPDGLRLVHALRDFSYMVALSIRGGGKLFLATAFPVDLPWRRDRLRKQYERYVRTAEP
jgi:hypothetical protein